MSVLRIRGGRPLTGSVRPPGDKSISHRALLLAGCAAGTSRIDGLGHGDDVSATVRCLSAFGVEIERSSDTVRVTSPGIAAWVAPGDVLDCGNSGTTMRLLAGLAARRAHPTVMDGDDSLRGRPMDRVARPLSALGATVALTGDRYPPVTVSGGELAGTEVGMEVASAQVKSAVLLAGLGASGRTTVVEPVPTRDHTERMLTWLGAPLVSEGHRISVEAFEVPPFSLDVAADPSSGAFLLCAGVLCGTVAVTGVCLNPGRTGFLTLLARMGAELTEFVAEHRAGEPVGTVDARRSELEGIQVGGSDVASAIDELPLLAVAATQARGTTRVTGAEELRFKESDRIAAVAEGLGRMGADLRTHPDGFEVRGPTQLRGAVVDSWGDHRIAMALSVAGLVAEGDTVVEGAEAAAVSWPGFADALASTGAEVEQG